MPLTFLWEGQVIPARPGDSIAAALAAAGIQPYGADRHGRARGQFCGMGVCQDCLVVVDGQRSQRACLTEVRSEMRVQPQDDRRAQPDPQDGKHPEQSSVQVDLAIVGAGPAGLRAAITAREAGLSICLLDERSQTGGQYFKPRSSGFRGTAALDRQHRRGNDLRQQAEACGARLLTGQTVWYARRGKDGSFEVRSQGASGQFAVTARAVLLATGAMERPAILPGWTLPGVQTIGAAQTLARRYGVSPGQQVLIAGHGPLGLQLGAELMALGARVVGVAERGRPGPGAALARASLVAPRLVRDGLAYRLRLLAGRVPVWHGWEVTRVLGDAIAEGAELRCLRTGETRTVAADMICLGDGFTPQIELARLLGVPVTVDPETGVALPVLSEDGATAVPGAWIAGDAGGLGGAEQALAQGAQSATGIVRYLGGDAVNAPETDNLARRARVFQAALWRLYQAPPRELPEDATTLCRCEGISAGSVRSAIAAGAGDLGAVKRATRLGMGRCQGRYCTAPALRLLADAGHKIAPDALFAPQLPARPIPVSALALEKPEWGGHRDSSPAARPGRAPTDPLTQTRADLVVIGAGITGIAAAYYAAREGAKVICLDRGLVNGEASGGNAGSLHLQLLSWDFGGKAVSGGSPQLQTLPLQQESIALWSTLETELGADFELRVTGGLMVAENPDQIAFLEAKAAAEARMGIVTEVIDQARIRQIVPAISDQIIAAAWCPGEGKINPLRATLALETATRRLGVTIEERTAVTGLERDGDGYAIATLRGVIRAPKVLIAAGGWSAQVGRFLGVELPIRGAPLQMVVTEPAPPLVPCLIAHADRHLTMKQTDAGTILIGGAWTAVTGPGGQPLVLPASLEGNTWVAAHTVPAIGGLSVIRSWAAMNIDTDGAPLIGALPGHPDVTVAATANGYTLGPLMGREAARIALTGRARQDIAAFSLDRFQS